jgi:serine/threonine protein kinase
MTPSYIAPPVANAVRDLERDFEITRSIPDGANGYVFGGRNRVSGRDVVIKFYAGAPGQRMHDEPRLLSSVRSPNVIDILDARTVDDEWAYFVTPLCGQGNLDDVIGTNPSTHLALNLALGICVGASAIHAVGLLHRDLKPANIVCESGTPLIADFGSVREVDGDGAVTSASGHAILYLPPETRSSGRYTVQGDIYQIGLITYQLLGGALSYDPQSYLSTAQRRQLAQIGDECDQGMFVDQVITDRAAAGRLALLSTLPPWVGNRAKACVRRMTAPDPADRYLRLSDAVADLQRARAEQQDWMRTQFGGTLLSGPRQIEVKQTAGFYAAYYVDTGRRLKGGVVGTLAEVVHSLRW